MNEESQAVLRTRQFGGDVERWRSETEQAVRRQAASGEQRGAGFGLAAGVRTVERAEWGWIRWGYPLQSELRFEAVFPAEVGVLAPGRSTGSCGVAAWVVWGRRPAPFVKRMGAAELPAAVSVRRLVLVDRLVEEAVPAGILDEVAEGLSELAAGLWHAQHAAARAAGPEVLAEEVRHGER